MDTFHETTDNIFWEIMVLISVLNLHLNGIHLGQSLHLYKSLCLWDWGEHSVECFHVDRNLNPRFYVTKAGHGATFWEFPCWGGGNMFRLSVAHWSTSLLGKF